MRTYPSGGAAAKESALRLSSLLEGRGDAGDTLTTLADQQERRQPESNRSLPIARSSRVERQPYRDALAQTPSLLGVDRRVLRCSLPAVSTLREHLDEQM
jgi:hypothetical protein